jgi:MFS family permease
MKTRLTAKLLHQSTLFKMLPILLIMGFYCLDYFYRISTGLIVPELMAQYSVTPAGIGFFASAFYLGYVLFQIPGGYLIDKLPLQKTIAAFIVICSLTFLGFIYSHDFYLGMLWRFLLGLASALSFVSVLHVARHTLDQRYFGLISGLTIAVGTLAGSLIQVYIAHAIQYWSWQTCLALSALPSLSIAFLFLLPFFKPVDTRLISTKPESMQFIPSLVQLSKQRGFILNAIIGGLFYLPTSILAAAWGVSLFTLSYHLSRTDSAFCLTLLFAGWSLGSPIIGYLNDHCFNYRITIFISALAAAIVSIIMIVLPQWVHHGVYLLAFLVGLFSSAQVSVWNIFNKLCPSHINGIGIALTNMIITLCAALFHVIEGFLIAYYSTVKSHSDLSDVGLLHGLWIIPGLFMISALLSQFLPQPAAKN